MTRQDTWTDLTANWRALEAQTRAAKTQVYCPDCGDDLSASVNHVCPPSDEHLED